MAASTVRPPTPSCDLLRRIAVLLGWISLFATLALLSPGVVATANAEEPAAGPSCPAAREGDEHTAADLSQTIERLRAEAAEVDGSAGGVRPLNTRGFNYANTARAVQAQPDSETR
ncbi:MAG TPA: hypothetical protein VKH41_04810 [Myxococcota bacterium]|nr:hypothetical protein [Myxococcota bacterium]